MRTQLSHNERRITDGRSSTVGGSQHLYVAVECCQLQITVHNILYKLNQLMILIIHTSLLMIQAVT